MTAFVATPGWLALLSVATLVLGWGLGRIDSGVARKHQVQDRRAELDRERTQRFLDDRRSAYATFLASATSAQRSLDDAMERLASDQGRPDERKLLGDASRALEQDSDVVDLLAPFPVRHAALNLQIAIHNYWGEVLTYESACRKGTYPRPAPENGPGAVRESMNAFRDAARVDLGVLNLREE